MTVYPDSYNLVPLFVEVVQVIIGLLVGQLTALNLRLVLVDMRAHVIGGKTQIPSASCHWLASCPAN